MQFSQGPMMLIEDYGYDRHLLLRSVEEARGRLASILSDPVLQLNPYSLDDESLMQRVEAARWTTFPALTQMVVMHFGEICRLESPFQYEAILFRLGDDPSRATSP